jgi:hypothetical protein
MIKNRGAFVLLLLVVGCREPAFITEDEAMIYQLMIKAQSGEMRKSFIVSHSTTQFFQLIPLQPVRDSAFFLAYKAWLGDEAYLLDSLLRKKNKQVESPKIDFRRMSPGITFIYSENADDNREDLFGHGNIRFTTIAFSNDGKTALMAFKMNVIGSREVAIMLVLFRKKSEWKMEKYLWLGGS